MLAFLSSSSSANAAAASSSASFSPSLTRAQVLALLFFSIVVFGILGVELLSRSLRGRCYIDPRSEANAAKLTAHPAVFSRLLSQQSPFQVSTDTPNDKS